MRVFHVVGSMDDQASGPFYSISNLASSVSNGDFSCKIYYVAKDACKSNIDRVPLQGFSQDWARFPIIRRLQASTELKRNLISDVDQSTVIHSHGLWIMPNIYPSSVAAATGAPLISSPRGMLGSGALQYSFLKKQIFWHLFQKNAADKVTCWHATSEKEYADIRAFGLRQPVAIIPNGIEVAPGRFSIPRERRVLFLGRLHPKKGLDSLLRVWSRLSRDFPKWSLDIVGPIDTAYARHYQMMADKLKLKRVVFRGALFGDAKESAFRAAAIFVLPTQDENFGIAVGDALARSIPVICTTAAPWSGLRSEGAGWWIEQGDEFLESTFRNAFSKSPQELFEMGQRGRAWVQKEFRWLEIGDRMKTVYRWLNEGGSIPSDVKLS